MFDVVISTVTTGRLVRKLLATRDQADDFIDRFMDGGCFPRLPRSGHVEVCLHEIPVIRPIPAGSQAPAARPAA
jgi:hypothetical protein